MQKVIYNPNMDESILNLFSTNLVVTKTTCTAHIPFLLFYYLLYFSGRCSARFYTPHKMHGGVKYGKWTCHIFHPLLYLSPPCHILHPPDQFVWVLQPNLRSLIFITIETLLEPTIIMF